MRSLLLPAMLLGVLSLIFGFSYGQVNGEIDIKAHFSHFIHLKVLESDVFWEVKTIEDYKKGFWPVQRPIPFQVASSTNFQIEYYNTPMVDDQGNQLILENLAYRLEPANETVKSDYNKKYQWAPDDGNNKSAKLSGIYLASLTPKTILLPGPEGNAGPYEQNHWKIRIGMASANIREITGLPRLLDQNITPGTYVSKLTLTAIPEP